MLPIFAFVAAGLFGGLRARKKGGNRMDMAQYAAIYGIVTYLVVLVIGVIVGRIYGF